MHGNRGSVAAEVPRPLGVVEPHVHAAGTLQFTEAVVPVGVMETNPSLGEVLHMQHVRHVVCPERAAV